MMKLSNVLVVSLFIVAAVSVTVAADSVPTITIPALNISSPITEFPLAQKTWAIDAWETAVGHLEGTAGFADSGNIVLAGHSKMPNGKPGIFNRLGELVVGDTISVFDGITERVYRITNVLTVSAEDVSVVYPTSNTQLTLLTCDTNSYNSSSKRYDRRVVVVAEPAS